MLVRRKQMNTIPKSISIPINEVSRNTYTEYMGDFLEGTIGRGESDFKTTITEQEIRDLLANPEDNVQDISNLMNYYYISNGDVYTLYTLFKSLPELNYKVGAFDNSIKRYEMSMSEIAKSLHKVRYKEMTRDIIGQVCVDGGCTVIWCGNKKSPYLYVFENNDYVFPRYRVNGDWECVVDMAWFEEMIEEERASMFVNLNPHVTETMFNSYKSDQQNSEKKYIPLPQDRTTYIRGDVLRRNQRIGTPLGTQSLFTLQHKETLLNLEKSISNRVQKNIGVLTIGNEEEGKSFIDISPTVRRQITTGIGKALKQNTGTSAEQIPIVSLPEFAKLEFSKVDSLDALKPEKFETVEKDLATGTGVSPAIATGSGSNFAGAKINLQYLYKRIAMILEQIDNVYEKMFKLILPKNVADNFYFEFCKDEPIAKEKELDILMQLTNQGYSVKSVIDMLSTIGFDDMIEQSIYEIEEMKLRDVIIPPKTSSTLSSEDVVGEGESSASTSEGTQKTNDNNGNANPNASV